MVLWLNMYPHGLPRTGLTIATSCFVSLDLCSVENKKDSVVKILAATSYYTQLDF